MDIKDIKEYELIEEREVSDLNSKGYVLKHKKSGARLMLLSNDDENKVFAIGFRTPRELPILSSIRCFADLRSSLQRTPLLSLQKAPLIPSLMP